MIQTSSGDLHRQGTVTVNSYECRTWSHTQNNSNASLNLIHLFLIIIFHTVHYSLSVKFILIQQISEYFISI